MAKFIDTLNSSFGIKIAGGEVDKILKKGMELPCEVTQNYQNSKDTQERLDFIIFEGENKMADQCKKLGKFSLHFKAEKAYTIDFKVTFKADENG